MQLYPLCVFAIIIHSHAEYQKQTKSQPLCIIRKYRRKESKVILGSRKPWSACMATFSRLYLRSNREPAKPKHELTVTTWSSFSPLKACLSSSFFPFLQPTFQSLSTTVPLPPLMKQARIDFLLVPSLSPLTATLLFLPFFPARLCYSSSFDRLARRSVFNPWAVTCNRRW